MAQTRIFSSSFTRPSNTTVYAAGDLVANSATAGSVVPIPVVLPVGRACWVRAVNLKKTKADITNANFRVWFLASLPTMVSGDNVAIEGPTLASILFEPIQVDAVALMTGAGTIGSSGFDTGMFRLPPTCYALIEATAAYTPASGEIFTLEVVAEPIP